MHKSLKRDKELLKRILSNQNKIKTAMKSFHYTNAAQVLSNTMCIDLCSFYLLNINESYILLTEQSQEALTYVDMVILRTLRNMIGHTYDAVNKNVIAAYAVTIAEKRACDVTVQQIKYCMDNAKRIV